MDTYQTLVADTLQTGVYKPNRTGVDTIAAFSQHYAVDLTAGFPLVTTKAMGGTRWDSLLHELVWYLSGDEHIRTLREETSIWDAWADDKGRLETAYGRFWRRFPVPDAPAQLPGEAWAADDCPWVHRETDGRRVFDQLQYVIDTLAGDNPDRDPHSRRLAISAWHPANAATSLLPPCHYTFVLTVHNDTLNVHLTQRSGDIALGIPFNIASYALLTRLIARETGFEVGQFAHTIADAHVYAGTGDRSRWYDQHRAELQHRLEAVTNRADYSQIREWVLTNAPAEPDATAGADHIPGLLRQLSREPYDSPTLNVADTPLDELVPADISLTGYESHDPLQFSVAE